MPSWITEDRRLLVQSLYKQLGLDDLLEQETMGITHSKHRAAFSQHDINYLFTKQPLYPTPRFVVDPRVIFSFIDPNNAGGSHIGVATAIPDCGTNVWIGLESIKAQNARVLLPILIEHYRRVRLIPRFRNSQIVCFIEANAQWAALNIGKFAHPLPISVHQRS